VQSWLQSKPLNLPLITVVETTPNGIQVNDICVDCLYKKLAEYGYTAFGRTKEDPLNIGVLFLKPDGGF
jgi:hypothetical protein